MTKIAIIIVNYNGEKDTKELLESLKSIKKVDFELDVIIVNNDFRRGGFFLPAIATRRRWQAGNPPHGEGQKKTPPYEIKIINNETNVGFARACNQGIQYSLKNGSDYICLLNNDTVVKPDFLINLLNIFQIEKDCGIVSPKIYFYPGQEFHKSRYIKENLGKVIWYAGGIFDWDNIYGSHRGVDEVDTGQYNKVQTTDYATGCCMFIKRKVIEKIGMLDEKYFAYLEDVDCCVRAKKAGYEIYYQPHAVIWHKNASSSGGPGSKLHYFLQERNRIYFGLKYASLKTKIHLLINAIQFLFSSNYKIALSLIKMSL